VLNNLDADIFCLQETKAQDDQVREALVKMEGYHLYTNSATKKGYSGTAILSRKEPIIVTPDIGIDIHDDEGRVLCAEYEDFYFVDVYVPNSGSGLKRLDYRAMWDAAFAEYLAGLQSKKPTIVTGDFNVAHQAMDLARPKENYNKTSGYTQVEIDGFDGILKQGFTDTFRHLYPEKVQYTFWNVRFRARERNVGWRLDYFLGSAQIMDRVKDAIIYDQEAGSDHCPIGLVLK
jgi:exodeoxyribonuclease-3